MNVEIGTEATQLPEKEYINRIFVVVRLTNQIESGSYPVFRWITGSVARILVFLHQRRYDMNGKFQMQGGKNWILTKDINANRFFWDSHWLEICINHLCSSLVPNDGSVAMPMDSVSSDPAVLSFKSSAISKIDFRSGRSTIERLVAPAFASSSLQYENKFYCLAAAAALIKYIEYTEKFTFARHSIKVDFQVARRLH